MKTDVKKGFNFRAFLWGGLSMFIPGAASSLVRAVEPPQFEATKKTHGQLLSMGASHDILSACILVAEVANEKYAAKTTPK